MGFINIPKLIQSGGGDEPGGGDQPGGGEDQGSNP